MESNEKFISIRKQLVRKFMITAWIIFIIFTVLITWNFHMELKRQIDLFSSTSSLFISEDLNDGKLSDDKLKKIDKVLADTIKGDTPFKSVSILEKKDNRWIYVVSKGEVSNSVGSELNKEDYIKELDGLKEKSSSVSKINLTSPHSLALINEKFAIETDVSAKVIKKVFYLFGIAGTVFLFLLATIVFLIGGKFAKKQTSAITDLCGKMKEISNLEADLTHRLTINKNDELGDLARYTNKMLDTLNDLLKQIYGLSVNLDNTNNRFINRFSEASESFTTMNDLMQNINARIQEETSFFCSVAKSIHNINESISNIADNSNAVNDTAIITSEHAKEGKAFMDKLEAHTKEITTLINDTSKIVSKLGDKSNKINTIADTINGIASQTNLLALNASIEAARAGEQGKGFAVVAEEVRKLAVESATSAKEIFDLITGIISDIENTSSYMNEVSQKAAEQNSIVEVTATKLKDIVESISEVSSKITEVTSATNKIYESNSVIDKEIENLTVISEENSASSNEVAASIESQLSNLHLAKGMTDNLTQTVNELTSKLSKLKLE